jgi:light-harvesting complex 1 beta chain
MPEAKSTLSGLSRDEAQEFHQLFMQGFYAFVGVSFVAHLLVWFWRPFF